jgi:hypothetical protein
MARSTRAHASQEPTSLPMVNLRVLMSIEEITAMQD